MAQTGAHPAFAFVACAKRVPETSRYCSVDGSFQGRPAGGRLGRSNPRPGMAGPQVALEERTTVILSCVVGGRFRAETMGIACWYADLGWHANSGWYAAC